MSALILDDSFNVETGLRTTVAIEDKKLHVRYAQDIEAAMQRNQALRNAPEYAKTGIKQCLQHAVHIPDSVCMKMLTEDGFDPYRSSAKELRAFLRSNRDKYGHLFVTAGRI